ncbi:MAG: hypothetical protein U0930_13840 [Pirellulales bacterium]
MMNFRPGDRIDILTSIKRTDIPLVYDATVLKQQHQLYVLGAVV